MSKENNFGKRFINTLVLIVSLYFVVASSASILYDVCGGGHYTYELGELYTGHEVFSVIVDAVFISLALLSLQNLNHLKRNDSIVSQESDSGFDGGHQV